MTDGSYEERVSDIVGLAYINVVGETFCFGSNINVNGGWIFYYSDVWRQEGIYKVKVDGTCNTKLLDLNIYTGGADSINVVGKYIYYATSHGIFRIDRYGGDKQTIVDTSAGFININGDLIYYNNSNDNKWYKIKSDGTENQVIE